MKMPDEAYFHLNGRVYRKYVCIFWESQRTSHMDKTLSQNRLFHELAIKVYWRASLEYLVMAMKASTELIATCSNLSITCLKMTSFEHAQAF